MAQVILNGELAALAGATTLQVMAPTVRAMIRELETRFPGMTGKLSGYAIAIDGEIIHTPLLEPLTAESEVHFLSPIEGG